MWTLSIPVVYKGMFIHELWLESLKRLELPKMDVVFLDMTDNEEATALFKNFFEEYKDRFKQITYIEGWQKEYRNQPNNEALKYTDEAFNLRRKAIGETMQKLNELRRGHMLLYEDDIIVPPDAFYRLKKIFDWSDEIYGVTGVQYTRDLLGKNRDRLLAWDLEAYRVFPKGDVCDEIAVNLMPKKYDKEWERQISTIDASASGFVLYRKEFLDQHRFDSSLSRGQDIMTGVHIKELGKKLMIDWSLKMPHLGVDDDGKFKIFRTWQCKTEVIDKYGTKF